MRAIELRLIRVRTADFSQLAIAFGGHALVESNYKRIQRFFKGIDVDEAAVAKALVAILDISDLWVLSVARTEWQFGASVFNILVRGVVRSGVAIPLVWSMLDKHGHSNPLERMNLFARFLEQFGQGYFVLKSGQLW